MGKPCPKSCGSSEVSQPLGGSWGTMLWRSLGDCACRPQGQVWGSLKSHSGVPVTGRLQGTFPPARTCSRSLLSLPSHLYLIYFFPPHGKPHGGTCPLQAGFSCGSVARPGCLTSGAANPSLSSCQPGARAGAAAIQSGLTPRAALPPPAPPHSTWVGFGRTENAFPLRFPYSKAPGAQPDGSGGRGLQAGVRGQWPWERDTVAMERDTVATALRCVPLALMGFWEWSVQG